MQRGAGHNCCYTMIFFRPIPTTPERLIVGFALFDTTDRSCHIRFISHFDFVDSIRAAMGERPLRPILLDCEPAIRRMIADAPGGEDPVVQPQLYEFPRTIEFSPLVSVSAENVQSSVLATEMLLFQLSNFLAPERKAKRQPAYGQAYLQQEIRRSCLQRDIWRKMDKNIEVDFVLEDDRYKIYAGYRDSRDKVYWLWNAVSLARAQDRAKILSLSWPSIKNRFEEKKEMSCQMRAIVENDTILIAASAKVAKGWMEQVGIHVDPVSSLAQLTADAQRALASR